MEVYIHYIPVHTNKIEIALFLREPLKRHDILAYEVTKRPGKNWATVALPDEKKGNEFLQHYGSLCRQPTQTPLIFQGSRLELKCSNRRGQPLPLQVKALIEADLKARSNYPISAPNQLTTVHGQPIFPIESLDIGIWQFDYLDKLSFDVKAKDKRKGTITLGKKSLVLYLRASAHIESGMHCRIDIPYSILEHTILSAEGEENCMMTFTLKTPPKIYMIQGHQDLHRYSPFLESLPLSFQSLNLVEESETRRLTRLSALHRKLTKSSALCMVYRIEFANVKEWKRAWSVIQRVSAMPDKDCHTTSVPTVSRSYIEADFELLHACLVATAKNSHDVLGFGCRFQILAIVLEGTLSPRQAGALIESSIALASEYGSEATASAIQRLGRELPTPGPSLSKTEIAQLNSRNFFETLSDIVRNLENGLDTSDEVDRKRKQNRHLARTFKATVTPTGLLLRGPEWGISNRVLRKYSQHTEFFMRVAFADEDGGSVMFDSRSDQRLVYARFTNVLQEGITVAERRYEFLGFSHSSLRDHNAWFMAPFYREGRLVCSQYVLQELGDFSHIHVAAKCAARIGQAFSDTSFAIRLPQHTYVNEHMDDVERNGYCFSDGCGTISKELLHKVWRALPPERHLRQPTVLQIRYRGAKGVVSLDPTLEGRQLCLRKSMTKFEAGESWKDIEICDAAYKPLNMFLSQQFVKILEDLGIPNDSFTSILQEAVQMLEAIVHNPINVANFLEYCRSGTAARIPSLFFRLHEIGLWFQSDSFLADVVEVAAMQALRDLKYRARIPVKKGMHLFGIMDEFNQLKAGEVYVATRTKDSEGRDNNFVLVQDRVAITRAPALHPGDIQLVRAVDVPNDSPLKSLYNCIVFSQRGERDLPSQLGGGDLDGDKFYVIYDERLVPQRAETAADYASAPAKDIGRSIRTNDIIEFFIEYMQSDRLGQISNMHRVKADIEPLGTKHPDCIKLAELASLAVDYTKSGQPVDMTKIPRGPYHIRPDFMSPSAGMVLNGKDLELEEAEMDDLENPDSINILDPDTQRIRYYKSDKILGQLYRSIDEFKFFSKIKNSFQATRDALDQRSLMEQLEMYIDRETRVWQWQHHHEFAEELREYYEENMLDIMNSLRPHRGQPLKELEVFSGNILGKKQRASTRAMREANIEVRERFNRDVASIILRIIKGDSQDDDEHEALPRAIACFKVALETKGWENYVQLQSWKYVTATVLLERLWMENDFQLRHL